MLIPKKDCYAIADIVKPFGPNWEDHLPEIAEKLDAAKIPYPVSFDDDYALQMEDALDTWVKAGTHSVYKKHKLYDREWSAKFEVAAMCAWTGELRITPNSTSDGSPDISTVFFISGKTNASSAFVDLFHAARDKFPEIPDPDKEIEK